MWNIVYLLIHKSCTCACGIWWRHLVNIDQAHSLAVLNSDVKVQVFNSLLCLCQLGDIKAIRDAFRTFNSTRKIVAANLVNAFRTLAATSSYEK